MHCANPYINGREAFGCGQCLPCRINKKRVWTHRIMLESNLHTDNAFVTLTYSDENLPKDGSLVPRDVQTFLKRLRKAVQPARLRFFCVGEYGDRTSRPHYHIALFGYPTCHRGRTDHRRNSCCPSCDLLRSQWPHGGIDLGRLEPESAAYVAGYVTKKLTNKDDEYAANILGERYPEFARMSNRPGIGADFMHEVASTLLEFDTDQMEDVPTALSHGKRILPLGTYLRKKLRKAIGRDEKAPISIREKAAAKLSSLHESAQTASPGFKEVQYKNNIVDAGLGKRNSLEAKSRIYKKRSTL